MALTKNDIVEQLRVELGLPKNQTVEIVESLLELIKSTLASGEDVLVSGPLRQAPLNTWSLPRDLPSPFTEWTDRHQLRLAVQAFPMMDCLMATPYLAWSGTLKDPGFTCFP